MGRVQVPYHCDANKFYMDKRKIVEKQYRKCEYCDSWYDGSLLKCPNCNAPADMESDKDG